MADFGTLKQEISEKLSDGDMIDPSESQIGNSLNRTIDRYRKKHFWFNEATAVITLNSGDAVVPNIPDDFGQLVVPNALTVKFSNAFYPLEKLTSLKYDMLNVEGLGLPSGYVYRNRQIELYYYPDQDYTLFLRYLKKYEPLVDNNDVNDFTENAEDLIVAKTVADCYVDYRRSPEDAAVYESIAKDEYSILMDEMRDRSATGYLTTENIVDRGGDSYYGGDY